MKKTLVLLLLVLVFIPSPAHAQGGVFRTEDGHVIAIFPLPPEFNPGEDYGMQLVSLVELYRTYIDRDRFINCGQLDTEYQQAWLGVLTPNGTAIITYSEGLAIFSGKPGALTITDEDIEIVSDLARRITDRARPHLMDEKVG